MKKRVLLLAAIAAAVFTSNDVNAQDFKPAGGEKNIEVNFTPMGATPIAINNLRLRYFSSSDMAFRVGFAVTSTSNTTRTATKNSQNADVELEDVSSSFGITINPGIEFHWEGTDRLSPYYGAELNFTTISNKTETQSLSATDAIQTGETTDGSTTFGLNLLLGADYYIAKSVYMGAEVGFGFSTMSEADTENKPAVGAPTTTPGGSSFNLGPNFNSAIRLGFLF